MTTPDLYAAKVADQAGWNPRLVGANWSSPILTSGRSEMLVGIGSGNQFLDVSAEQYWI